MSSVIMVFSVMYYLLLLWCFLLCPVFCYCDCYVLFQLASQVTSWTEIILKFNYYHPPRPTHPPKKVEMQLEIGHIWSVGSWWIVCLVIFGGRGGLWGWSESNLVALHRRDPSHLDNIINSKFTKYGLWKSSGWLVYDFDWLELTVIAGQFGLLCRDAYKKVSKQVSMEASN